ncbi:MAG: hypothetical protein JO057_30075 [Chloroflexi bacterium]|nr:hypothetical protein [Chloroflexota bacterium]
MRSVLGTFLVFAVVAMLVVTTPIGTGEGVHQDEILHPVLPHSHMINGRIVSHAEADAAAAAARNSPSTSSRTRGPAVGSGSGADASALGVAIYPNVPVALPVLPLISVARTVGLETDLPHEFLDAPPDPPPDFAG